MKRASKKIPHFVPPVSAQNVPVALRSGFGSSMAEGLALIRWVSSMQPDQCIEEKVVAVISLLIVERIKYLVSSFMNLSVHYR